MNERIYVYKKRKKTNPILIRGDERPHWIVLKIKSALKTKHARGYRC